MADAGLFVGWGIPVRGREAKSLEVFNESVQYWGQPCTQRGGLALHDQCGGSPPPPGGAQQCPNGTHLCTDGLCCFGTDLCCANCGTGQCCVVEVGCACCG